MECSRTIAKFLGGNNLATIRRVRPFDMAADVYYNDGFYFLPQNGEVSYEPAYTTVNARVSYRIEDWGVRVSLYGQNVTDEQYNIAQFFTDFGRLDTMAPPASYGAKVSWEF